MPRMLYLGGVLGFSSMLSLTTRRRSLNSVAMVSRIGAIILQGVHHSAQKSSSTGCGDLTTSSSNAASDVCTISALTIIDPLDVFFAPKNPLERKQQVENAQMS